MDCISWFLAYLSCSFPANANSKNLNKQCQGAFSDLELLVTQIRDLGQNKPEDPKIHKALAKILFRREEFETEEDNQIKEKAVKAIKEIDSKSSKTQNILVDSLELFKSKKHSSIRMEIYSFFEIISQHITVKAARKLAKLIRGGLSPKEKEKIIRILKERKPTDTLTIQYLGEGLNDSSPEVRRATAEVLGEILQRKPNLLAASKESLTQSMIYPIKSIFDVNNIVKDIRLYIISKLYNTILFDPETSVKIEAIKTMVKISDIYVLSIDALIEIISSDAHSEVKKEAISGLEAIFTNNSDNFHKFKI